MASIQWATQWFTDGSGKAPLLIGAALLYAASLAAMDALGGGVNASPGRRALANWIPIAIASLAALFFHRGVADLAMAIIFTTSVASLSFVLGFIVLVRPSLEDPQNWRRFWPFIIPATILALLAGFAGTITWIHALIFFIEGVVLLEAWIERSTSPLPDQPPQVQAAPVPAHPHHYKSLNLFLSITLLLVCGIAGAIAAVTGSIQITQHIPWIAVGPFFMRSFPIPQIVIRVTIGLIVVFLLGPLLVIPMFLSGADQARRGRAWAAITANIGVVLLNLCLLLPLIALLWYPVSAMHLDWHHLKSTTTDPLTSIAPLTYSLINWRVDTVILVLLSFVLLPVCLGRWRLGRSEGLLLIFLYVVYIFMQIGAVMRL